MGPSSRPPAGPRGAIGAAAESAAAAYLRDRGWIVLARNLRVGRDEIDILAREPGSAVLVVVEVRARSCPGFGVALESVDARKVAHLYRAAFALLRGGHADLPWTGLGWAGWRVDLLTLRLGTDGRWQVEQHLRGLGPP